MKFLKSNSKEVERSRAKRRSHVGFVVPVAVRLGFSS